MALTTIEPFGINSSNSFTFGNVTATGNVTGNFFIGNGSQLTGLPEGYANADVAAYLPTYTGNLVSLTGNVTTTANISASYVLGNGSQLTGLPESYSNANVAAYLPTYTGNLSSLQGNVTTTANISGNYILGNGSGLTSITGANVTGQVANALVSSTVYTAAQPNITSVGTLSSLSVTGNITGGNLLGTIRTAAQPNITSVGTLSSLSVTGNVDANNVAATSVLSANTLSIANTASISGNLTMNSRNITGVANPVLAQDAATKTYVDTLVASGIHFHDPVRVESPINLNATYNNGTAGVGATLTNAGTQAALVIDGITMVVADRVLVYEQTNETQNGIYVVTDIGSGSTNWILTRASDADTYVINSADGLSEGSSVFVQQGATGAGELYTCNTAGVITFGTTNITFAQISSAQIYSAGTGLTLTNTTFSITNTAVTAGSYGSADRVATFTVNGQGQLTAAANTVITANAANLTGTVLNSSVVTSSLTSVGTLSSLSVTGNITSGNVIANNIPNWTAANAAPISPTPGSWWYNTTNNAIYLYVNDGDSNQWVDQSFPTVFETVTTGSILNSNANGVGNIGTSSTRFNTVFAKASSAQYADLAEIYSADQHYVPGTVVIFGGTHEVTASTQVCDTRVAGVVSTNPAYIMNADADGVAVALTGRVPCQVRGPVDKGDVLVTSETPGTAQKISSTWAPGCVIGKSLQSIKDNSVQLIEIAVGRF